MGKNRTEKRLAHSSPVVYGAGAMALGLLGFYLLFTVYSSDDYWYSVFWNNGLAGYLELMAFHYQTFNGRVLVHVLAHALLALGNWAFLLVFIGLYLLMVCSVLRANGVQRRFLTAATVFLLGVLLCPGAWFRQTVSWISGACNYVFPTALLCVLVWMLETNRRGLWLLAFLCGATTEQSGLTAVVITAVYLADALARRMPWKGKLAALGSSLIGLLTIFLSPATALRAEQEIGVQTLAEVLGSFRNAIELEANLLTLNPVPVLVILALAGLGAAAVHRSRAKRWMLVPFGGAGVFLIIGWRTFVNLQVFAFVLTFVMLAICALVLICVGRRPLGVLMLAALGSAAVMLVTDTISPRVMMPFYLLMLVCVSVLAAELYDKSRALTWCIGLCLAAAVLQACSMVPGYWHNYRLDLENRAYAAQDREQGAVRFCTDYDMAYTWLKPNNSDYFWAKYLESRELPEDIAHDFFSRESVISGLRAGGLELTRIAVTESEGNAWFPLREVVETMGGTLVGNGMWMELTMNGQHYRVVICTEWNKLVVDWTASGEVHRWVGACQKRGPDTYCDAGLLTEVLGLTLRFDAQENSYIIE